MIDHELARQTGLPYIFDALEPQSPFGAERLHTVDFYADETALCAELSRVQALTDCPAREELTQSLARPLMLLKDIRASLRRCAEGSALSLLELFELKGLLLALAELKPCYERLCPLDGISFSDPEAALRILDPTGERRRSFTVEDAATPALFALRREKRAVEAELYQTADESRRTELRLRREDICAREDAEETTVCAALSAELQPYMSALLADCETAGHLDLLLRKTAMAERFGAAVPSIGGEEIVLESMTNPALADNIAARGGAFTPVSIALLRGASVITGANMGGKTVALKTLALNVLLAGCGFPVCAHSARLPHITSLRFLAGDAEQTGQGLSSFGGELVHLREALADHDEKSLLLLDEPARGTNPDEGAAIVRGTVEHLERGRGFAVVATHYDSVADRAKRHYRIVGLRDMDSAAVEAALAASDTPDPSIIAQCMDYGLYLCDPAEPCPREALAICRLLKLPEELLEAIRHNYL